MIKCIVSDLDGTLFHGHGETIFDITHRNDEAIKNCVQNNILFVVASGRSTTYGQRILANYYPPKDIVVGGLNGAMAYINEKHAYTLEVDFDDMVTIIEVVKKHPELFKNIQAQGLDDTRYYYDLEEERAKFYKVETSGLGIGCVYDEDLETCINQGQRFGLGKLLIMTKGRAETLQLKAILEKQYADKYCFTGSAPHLLEINHINATKGKFVEYIMDLYNLAPSEVAVIGDSFNDESMFEVVEHSFSMTHGEQELKDKAKYIVEDVAACVEICLKLNYG